MINKLFNFLFLSLILVSCAAHKVPVNLNIHLDDNFTRAEAMLVVDASFYAFDKLLNCEYLSTFYPRQYDMLLDLKNGFVVQKVPESVEKEYEENNRNKKNKKFSCGRAPRNIRTFGLASRSIYLTNKTLNYVMDNVCNINETIPHEILHLLGFSHEKSKKDEKELKKLEYMCIN